MYRCEAWTINKEIENRLKAAEIWYFRRMLKGCYLNRITNTEVLERAGRTRTLVDEIRKRLSTFLNHVMRKRYGAVRNDKGN